MITEEYGVESSVGVIGLGGKVSYRGDTIEEKDKRALPYPGQSIRDSYREPVQTAHRRIGEQLRGSSHRVVHP